MAVFLFSQGRPLSCQFYHFSVVEALNFTISQWSLLLIFSFTLSCSHLPITLSCSFAPLPSPASSCSRSWKTFNQLRQFILSCTILYSSSNPRAGTTTRAWSRRCRWPGSSAGNSGLQTNYLSLPLTASHYFALLRTASHGLSLSYRQLPISHHYRTLSSLSLSASLTP